MPINFETWNLKLWYIKPYNLLLLNSKLLDGSPCFIRLTKHLWFCSVDYEPDQVICLYTFPSMFLIYNYFYISCKPLHSIEIEQKRISVVHYSSYFMDSLKTYITNSVLYWNCFIKLCMLNVQVSAIVYFVSIHILLIIYLCSQTLTVIFSDYLP